MKITLPKLRGKKHRACNPVSRSKSWAEKKTVKTRVGWREDQNCTVSPPPSKRFASSPDLTCCNVVSNTFPRNIVSNNPAREKQISQDLLNTDSSDDSSLSSPTPSLNTLLSTATFQQLQRSQIKQSSLTMILPDQERLTPPDKPIRTKHEVRRKGPDTTCVQVDCVVCTLARPEVRHRAVLQPGFWREFF